ncbi:9462_t:CDS:2, partial [Funneliformis geosporum]
MSYKIGTIGQRFLLMMEVDYNQNYFNPSTMFENLSGNKKNLFQDSLFNPNFYLRAADEIMEKIFTPDEKNRLQELIVELKEKEASLIASASSKVSKIMNEHKSQSLPLHDYNNLNFSLIEINPERFPESYNLFKQMLKDTEQGTRFYDKNEIKGFFSKALEELEKFAKDVKDKKKSNETKKEETANLGEEKNQSEGDKHNPTDSKEKPEGKNNSENNENTNESNNTDSPNLAKLQTLKTQAIAEITAALDQIPPLTSSDLASDVLFDIQDQRKAKIKKQTTSE